MGKLSENEFRDVKPISGAPSKGRKPYKQVSDIEYQSEYFDLYEKELKTDLCWAIDTRNLALLDAAYKEARRLLGVSKGRPKTIYPVIQARRKEVKAHFCLYLSKYLGESYSNIWAGFFQNKNQPKKPESNIPSKYIVRHLCEKYPEKVQAHLFRVLDPDTNGRELLQELLQSTDNK